MKQLILKNRSFLIALLHLLLATDSYLLAYMLRFEGNIPPQQHHMMLKTLPVLLAFRYLTLWRYSLFQGLWRYVSMDDVFRIVKACTAGSVAFLVYIALVFHMQGFPRSVLVIDWVLSICAFSGVRFVTRFLREQYKSKHIAEQEKKRILIAGAGDAGELALREIEREGKATYQVMALVDDNESKQGMMLHGCKVKGRIRDIPKLVSKYDINQVLIAMPSATRPTIRNIVNSCPNNPVKFRILPAMRDLITGEQKIQEIRDVALEDLLGRPPVRTDGEYVRKAIKNKCVLITGAGGSIGSEIVRQVTAYGPRKVILMDCAETPLFNIEQEIRARMPDCEYVSFLGDIKHEDTLNMVFAEHVPDDVYHAAAYKHVPLMEDHASEAILNNIRGTRLLAETAARHGTKRFVVISTDKAVNPSSIMGATKRCAELLILSLENSNTKFSAVRFGNVLGSNGSVVEVFKQQIANGGPVTVTHPEMTRYFMTIPEAVDLVLHAGVMAEKRELFVLQMGESVRIIDLAQTLIELSGMEPEKDIRIELTAPRAGEKLHEELASKQENLEPSDIPGILVLKNNAMLHMASQEYREAIIDLEQTALSRDNKATADKLWNIIRKYGG